MRVIRNRKLKLSFETIPTLPSGTPSTEMLVLEAMRVLREIDRTLALILAQMRELVSSLPEYPVVRAMEAVGPILAPRLIAEIRDICRFHSGKALIAFVGIYQSGRFTGSNRHISKRGSALLRKTGFEIMKCIKSSEPLNGSVYQFILKKEGECKAPKFAGLNKFLRIYYARAKEVYLQQ